MKNKKKGKIAILLVLLLLAVAILTGSAVATHEINPKSLWEETKQVSYPAEAIEDEQVPLAAPQPTEAPDEQTVTLMAVQQTPAVNAVPTATPAPQRTTEPAIEPAPEAPQDDPEESQEDLLEPQDDPEEPQEDPLESQEDPLEPQDDLLEPQDDPEAEAPIEPTPTPAPAIAQKPDDITDVVAMAQFLFDAATEFWATEKDFSGTTTRPVSTRVASSIGAGTAVDCPGGDTLRIDANGIAHDSYAIADHFRDYVEMPDLQYFKIYLSDKDYSVNPYGAREDVIGSFYQYGSERATYQPDDEEDSD